MKLSTNKAPLTVRKKVTMKIKYEYLLGSIAVLFAISTIMPGCSKYDSSSNDIFSDYGTAYKYDGAEITTDYYIIRDDGAEMNITSNLWPDEEPANGARVKFNYEITKTTDRPAEASWMEKHEITLYFISSVRTERPIMESFIMENEKHRRDSIGNDPLAGITRIFFSGGFVNVEYRVYAKVAEEKAKDKYYMVNLVVDDINNTDELITVRMCYNAKGELPLTTTDAGYEVKESEVSFDLDPLVPEGKNAVTIRFIWTEQQRGEMSQTKTYNVKQ